MKKTLYLILGAIFAFGILFLLWSWLFSGSTSTQTTGQFGTSTDATQSLGTAGNTTNGQTNLGQNTANGTIPLGTNGAASSSSGNIAEQGGTTAFSSSVDGVQWLNSNGSGGTISDSGNGYNPVAINGLNGASVGGTVPTLQSTTGGSGSGSNSNLNLLLAAGVIGVGSCALQASGNTIGSFLAGGTVAVVNPAAAVSVPVNDITANGIAGGQAVNQVGKNVVTFQGCLTNVLAKIALQQITASVVNWINSGFNGQPSFVTNYQQFFSNVANLAAGQFIQGAGLSFLCSPFKLQIKIAVAQSYANQGAQSCTLTGVINNINSFMSGNFSQGGWAGMLSYTTTPTNNPYGAYAYAQIGLANAQNTALANAKNNISPTGFLNTISFGQAQSCNNVTTITGSSGVSTVPIPTAGQNSQAAKVTCPPGCTCSIATPGSVIEASLDKTLGSGVDQLGLASDLDQIINALTTQLITKTLQGGLSNLSGTDGVQSTYQTPDEAAAQAQAQGILSNMQAQVQYAQEFGSIQQGSISDIENTQSALNDVINCWNNAASSTSLSSAQTTAAANNAASAQSSFDALTAQINSFNDSITAVNAEVATIEQLQTEALSIASTDDVTTLTNNYTAAQSTTPFIAAADVTTAQQNRTTLQSSLANTNAAAQSSLSQCQAL